ncbi:unnamed protein product [Schistocephalus solidus]|uniref:C2H2-type domain-containing protein n=1 Tax=Schistocephalus solidus TaxID=70667 RepID=A0A183S828_SCHSO|nr:unnamed protein product [Schistocephalus solidus]
MGLFGHISIHQRRIPRDTGTPSKSCSYINTTIPSPPTIGTTAAADLAFPDPSCLHCHHAFTSRIGLVSQLRILPTKTGEPVPGVPTYSHFTRLQCSHCPRTFVHRIGLLGHMCIYENLW